jgi:DNA ligase-1
MKRFAALLDALILTPQRNTKLALLADYFATTGDPHRGFALAVLTGSLEIASVKPAMLRALVRERVDGELFAYSYDYVGDLAETISLIWPARHGGDRTADLAEIVESLQRASRGDGPRIVEGWLDALDITGRWALIKLVAGGLRIGVSARLTKQALANFGEREITEIEEIWHGLEPPYTELFAWLEGTGPRPQSDRKAPFRPVMLSHPIGEAELGRITPLTHYAEWKWDGIRVQAVREAGVARLYTRTGDDISATFPDMVAGLDVEGAIDGELLIGRAGESGFVPGSFSDLQQRLNRKTVSRKMLETHPAFLRAYDCLLDGTLDVRNLPLGERRQHLEEMVARSLAGRIDLSPLLTFTTVDELTALRAAPPDPLIEGLMLKRRDSTYQPGRPRGPWFKWKRDPHLIDAVLMYAQRGHGKRSSFYSDYTFGVWRDSGDGDELVPVGKAYFGFTDEELGEIDLFVRNNTLNRFGPVREVTHTSDTGLVLEIAFEALNRSTRHKSGVAMRFPRVSRLRWDKPPAEADRLETLIKLIKE